MRMVFELCCVIFDDIWFTRKIHFHETNSFLWWWSECGVEDIFQDGVSAMADDDGISFLGRAGFREDSPGLLDVCG